MSLGLCCFVLHSGSARLDEILDEYPEYHISWNVNFILRSEENHKRYEIESGLSEYESIKRAAQIAQ